MSWREAMTDILDVVLRVPPLFLVDATLGGDLLYRWSMESYLEELTVIPWIICIISCWTSSLILFVLPTKYLFEVYSNLLAVVLLCLSYRFNLDFLQVEFQDDYDNLQELPNILLSRYKTISLNIILQVILMFCYNSLQHHSYVKNGWIHFCVLQTTILRLLCVPQNLLTVVPATSFLIINIDFVFCLFIKSRVVKIIKKMYNYVINSIKVLGVQAFIENQWIRLHIPNVLRVFWITRAAFIFVCIIVEMYIQQQNNNGDEVNSHEIGGFTTLTKEMTVTGCDNILSVMGTTSIISFLTYHFGLAVARFLHSDNQEDKNMGTVSAILFFILALQTGLTGLTPDKRLTRLYQNCCLLLTAILHFIHSMVTPLLMNLSAFKHPAIDRHMRPLSMCSLLVLIPMLLMYYLWSNHSLSTWILAVTAFSIEIICKVIITILQYTFFMIDAYSETFWEELDDYVYYIKSVGNSIEFMFGIFLFGNGAWIMIFESGGTIRACMMTIHAYFNIWMQAKEGWKVFIKRRTAVNKMNLIPEATQEQLLAHNDVCAICYHELHTAKITNCNHYFHSVCLRKWLYLQDVCPLCHALIYKEIEDSGNEENNEELN